MGFRYSYQGKEIIMKLVPDDSNSSIDVNAMVSSDKDNIYSATLPIKHIDLTHAEKTLLDNLDSWAAESGNQKHFITKEYIINVLQNICPKPKEEEAKTNKFGGNLGGFIVDDRRRQPQPLPSGGPNNNPYFNPLGG